MWLYGAADMPWGRVRVNGNRIGGKKQSGKGTGKGKGTGTGGKNCGWTRQSSALLPSSL